MCYYYPHNCIESLFKVTQKIAKEKNKNILLRHKATIHTAVAPGTGVRFHESSTEPLRVWENRMKNPGIDI